MQIGKKRVTKHYPIKIPQREAIPVTIPVKKPARVPEKVEK